MPFQRVNKILYSIVIILFLALTFTSCSSHKSARKKYYENLETIKRDKAEEKEVISHLHGKVEKLIKEAFTWVGTPYVYGAQEKGKGTDCSGYTMVIFEEVLNCKIPRNSLKQYEFCKKIPEKKIRPGDLVFFATGSDSSKINHVGIMVDELQFLHASSKGVRLSRMDSDYYIRHFKGYGRVPCLDD